LNLNTLSRSFYAKATENIDSLLSKNTSQNNSQAKGVEAEVTSFLAFPVGAARNYRAFVRVTLFS